ncbi:MAG: polysaccharide biosynthesis/export family protein [Saprospiraceae bacterium]|nr:polysaccharide biosynthesis/export family protein [Pyrinomonadaceae bacterium]
MRNITKIPALSILILSALISVTGQTVTPPANDATQADPKKDVIIPTAFPGTQIKDERYRIGFQDKLDIQVFRHPELSQSVNVNSNGTINLFRLDQPLVAVCKTERELGDDVAAAYRKDYLRNPQVNVNASEKLSQAFAVIGAVEKPGNYFISRKVRLLELLAQAGGPSKEAGTRVLVARTGSTSNCKLNDASEPAVEEDIALLDFKISEVMEGKRDLVMRPGDIVSVMDADVVYVYGNVNKQGQVIIKEPITLTQALASSEGLKPATKKDNIRIIRQKPGSLERDEFIYNLNDIAKRKVDDPFLQPNDIVAVSEDRTKSILIGIKNSLTQGASSIFYRFP